MLYHFKLGKRVYMLFLSEGSHFEKKISPQGAHPTVHRVQVPDQGHNVRCTLTFEPAKLWGKNLGLVPSGGPGGSAPGGGIEGGLMPSCNKKRSHFSTKKRPKNQLFRLFRCCTLTSGPHCKCRVGNSVQ